MEENKENINEVVERIKNIQIRGLFKTQQECDKVIKTYLDERVSQGFEVPEKELPQIIRHEEIKEGTLGSYEVVFPK